MIYIIIGTKAQFIKLAPVIKLISEREIPFRIVDLAQHAAITRQILDDFELDHEVIRPVMHAANVSSYFQGLIWMLKHFALLCRPSNLRKLLSTDRRGFVLVHGDTASTFIGMLYAKKLGLATGLVEAGLTSGALLSPFPEELIRRTVEHYVDILFVPGRAAAETLQARRLRGHMVDTQYNTGRDALKLIVANQLDKDAEIGNSYALCTLHRLETIGQSTRLRKMIEYLIDMGVRLGRLKFVMHEPTRRALQRCGLLARLTTIPEIEISDLQSYPDFIRLLRGAHWILTDGGSVQEEASYFGKPCLILRSRTERPHGIGVSASLASFDSTVDAAFLQKVTAPEEFASTSMMASLTIVDVVQNHLKNMPCEASQ